MLKQDATKARFSGTLDTWHDERGFGFVKPASGGQDIFVHISAFPSGTGRPVVGQTLSFAIHTRADGKKSAIAIQYPARVRQGSRSAIRSSQDEPFPPWTGPRLAAIPVFLLIYAASCWLGHFSLPILLAYLGMSLLTFITYGMDKAAAKRGQWRTPESTLHLLALAGGWPGALLAQQQWRHKTQKAEFIGVFWVTVIMNVLVYIGWCAKWWTTLMR